MTNTHRMQMFLLRDMIESVNLHLDNYSLRFSDLLELILEGNYFLPVKSTWSNDECNAFQERNAAALMRLFKLDRKEAEIEVSWFLYRYGFRIS